MGVEGVRVSPNVKGGGERVPKKRKKKGGGVKGATREAGIKKKLPKTPSSSNLEFPLFSLNPHLRFQASYNLRELQLP